MYKQTSSIASLCSNLAFTAALSGCGFGAVAYKGMDKKDEPTQVQYTDDGSDAPISSIQDGKEFGFGALDFSELHAASREECLAFLKTVVGRLKELTAVDGLVDDSEDDSAACATTTTSYGVVVPNTYNNASIKVPESHWLLMRTVNLFDSAEACKGALPSLVDKFKAEKGEDVLAGWCSPERDFGLDPRIKAFTAKIKGVPKFGALPEVLQ